MSVQTRSDWLDVGRALAIAGVVAVHTGQTAAAIVQPVNAGLWSSFLAATSLGLYGVEFFFFISGWLIAMLYTDALVVRHYSIRRVARIVPLWLVFLLVAVAENAAIGHGPWTDALRNSGLPWPLVLLLTVTFTGWLSDGIWNSVVPGGWSIQVEVAHYVVFPLLRRIRFERLGAVLAFILAAGLAAKLCYQLAPNTLLGWIAGRINLWAFPLTLQFFMFGVVGQWAWSRHRKLEALHSGKLPKQGLVAWLVLLGLLAISPIPFGSSLQGLGFVGLAIAASVLLSQTSMRKPLQWLGRRSYFIYFAHFQVLFIIRFTWLRHGSPLSSASMLQGVTVWSVLYLLSLAVSSVAAGVSYRWFERPILQAAHRISSPG